MSKYCTNCGKGIAGTSRFCEFCGKEVLSNNPQSNFIDAEEKTSIKANQISIGKNDQKQSLNPKQVSKKKSFRLTTSNKKLSDIDSLSGWLSYFALGLGISVLFSVYNAYTSAGLLSNEILVHDYKGSIIFITVGYCVLTILQIFSLIKLFKLRRTAKYLVLLTLLAGIVIYGFTSSLTSTIYGNLGQSVPMDASQEVTRAIGLSIIWILYFLLSRRVRLTLTK